MKTILERFRKKFEGDFNKKNAGDCTLCMHLLKVSAVGMWV